MSRITCHLSRVTIFLGGGLCGVASLWRVCYQRGLSRLVSRPRGSPLKINLAQFLNPASHSWPWTVNTSLFTQDSIYWNSKQWAVMSFLRRSCHCVYLQVSTVVHRGTLQMPFTATLTQGNSQWLVMKSDKQITVAQSNKNLSGCFCRVESSVRQNNVVPLSTVQSK